MHNKIIACYNSNYWFYIQFKIIFQTLKVLNSNPIWQFPKYNKFYLIQILLLKKINFQNLIRKLLKLKFLLLS